MSTAAQRAAAAWWMNHGRVVDAERCNPLPDCPVMVQLARPGMVQVYPPDGDLETIHWLPLERAEEYLNDHPGAVRGSVNVATLVLPAASVDVFLCDHPNAWVIPDKPREFWFSGPQHSAGGRPGRYFSPMAIN